MFKLIPRKYHRLVIRLVKQLINPQVLALIAAIAAVLLLCLFSPLKAVFNPILFKNFIEQHEGYIEVVFIALYTILTIVGIPGTVLTVVGGSLFGIWYGTLISTIAATAGALGAFCAARYLFHQSAQRKFRRSKKLSRFQSAVLKQPFLFVLTTRLVPISPFNLVNYLFGLTSIHWLDYALATFVGIIPGTLAYCWIGQSGEIALAGGDRLSLILALSFLTLLSVIPLIYRHKKA